MEKCELLLGQIRAKGKGKGKGKEKGKGKKKNLTSHPAMRESSNKRKEDKIAVHMYMRHTIIVCIVITHVFIYMRD